MSASPEARVAAGRPSGAAQRMSAADQLRAAWEGLLAHKLRSALAALGIVIGVAATIVLAMIMQALAGSLNRQFEGLGARTLTVHADTAFEDALRGRVNRLRLSDVDALRRLDTRVAEVTPMLAVAGPFGGAVSYRGHDAVSKIFGTTESYARLHRLFAASGRFLTGIDDASHRRICVIGERTRRDLGLGAHPEGEFIQVLGAWFKVVGVLDKRGALFGISQDDDLLIPYDTALAFVAPDRGPDLLISFDVPGDTPLADVQDETRRVLRRAHRLRASQADDFVVETAEELRATYTALSAKLTLGLGIVVGISLLVSGIGILNIMLVSVAERTREIGIMKALGARDADVLRQFMLEATSLTLLGCVAGVVLGLGVGAALVAAMPDTPPPAVPWGACVLSALSSAVVGLVFGVVPAQRAAALPPVEALRHE